MKNNVDSSHAQDLRLILYSRKDCHLCEEAKIQILRSFPGLSIEEVDVDTDPALAARFGGEVPVGFLAGEKAFKYRVDTRRLRRLLRKAGRET